MHRISFIGPLVFLALIQNGCGGSDAQPETPPTEARTLTPAQDQAMAKASRETNGQGGLNIDQTIIDLCPGVKPAYFGTDSSRVKAGFSNSLMALADCLQYGALKGKSLLLVGHADERGTNDYNLALGGRRAGAVQEALVQANVTRDRLETSSRGEVGAEGTSESTWRKDRRVDVKLLP